MSLFEKGLTDFEYGETSFMVLLKAFSLRERGCRNEKLQQLKLIDYTEWWEIPDTWQFQDIWETLQKGICV